MELKIMIPDEKDENFDEDLFDDLEDLDEPEEIAVPETIATATGKKINYLNNKDMLKEIHKSKNSYCEYIDPKYSDYDVIVEQLEDIFIPATQQLGQVSRASRLSVSAFEVALANTTATGKSDRPKLSEYKIKPDTIPVEDLVYRVLTFEHIPLAPGRKKNPKSTADRHLKVNFYPFKHYIIEDGQAKEVGRSHHKKGKFDSESGSITNKLAKMFILLVNKYAQRSNWRGYTYLDEMRGQALLQLAQMGLQFDEYKSDNPFSYYTASISNSFTRVLNFEKKNQDLRDDLLIDSGSNPSFSRQLAVEDEIRRLREEAQESARGNNE
jgi:hypothetical protein